MAIHEDVSRTLFIVGGLATLVGAVYLRFMYEVRRAFRQRHSSTWLEKSKPALDHHIALLLDHFGADTFASPQLSVPLPRHAPNRDHVASLLRQAAELWQVTPPPIDVCLVAPHLRASFAGLHAEVPAAWQLTLSDTGALQARDELGWRIAIDPAYLMDDLALSVIVAHEFAHGVLGRDGIALADRGALEQLTDVAIALIGYGELMIRLHQRVEWRGQGSRRRLRLGGPGYLSIPEIQYCLDRRRALLAA